MPPTFTTHVIFLYFITVINIFVKSTNYETPHCVILSIHLCFRSKYSPWHIALKHIHPMFLDFKFNTHIRQEVKLYTVIESLGIIFQILYLTYVTYES
jgi:hypothetical protein